MISKEIISKYLKLYIIFTIILTSGTVIGFRYLNVLWITQLLSAILLVILNGEFRIVSRRKMLYSVLILLSFFGNIAFIAQANYAMMGSMMISLLTCFLLSISCTKDEYAKDYIYLIAILALLSLVQYSLSQVGIFIGGHIVEASSNRYYVSVLYHVYRSWTNSIGFATVRNTGIFWEPGAYQIFLNLALLLAINTKIRYKISILLILVISVLTTRSSTGYFLLILIGILYYTRSNDLTIKKLVGILFVCIASLMILSSPTITEKVYMENESTVVRLNDVEASLEVCMRRPLLGYGYNSSQMYTDLEQLGCRYNSAGLLSFFIMFGIPFSLLIFFNMIKNIFRMAQLKKLSIVDFVILLLFMFILHMTEHFMVKEVFLVFIFPFLEIGENI